MGIRIINLIQDSGFRMQDRGYRIQDAGCKIQDFKIDYPTSGTLIPAS